MWFTDLQEAMLTFPKEWKYSVCFESVFCGFHCIIFRAATADYVYWFDKQKWERVKRDKRR